MLELEFDLAQDRSLVYVQDEPALEIALPQAFDQPALTSLQRGKIPDAESLAVELFRRHQANPVGALGPDYQEFVNEFQPLFAWTIACWDYLLSTEGCRFIPRTGEQKFGARGDYRAVTDKDYSRMTHGIFRTCIFDFARETMSPGNGHLAPGGATGSLSQWLRERFWPMTREAYRRLNIPPDPRQRTLTPYSYLRCVPYQFLNDYHHDLVYTSVKRLPEREGQVIDAHFLHFFTEPASAQTLGGSVEECAALLRQALVKLLIHERLVYCLLRQIERY